ncbi:MAG: hypothetical protein ACUVSA_14150 [Desulfosoma sp.]
MARFYEIRVEQKNRVIDKRRIIRVLGRFDDSHMQNIAKALSAILGL